MPFTRLDKTTSKNISRGVVCVREREIRRSTLGRHGLDIRKTKHPPFGIPDILFFFDDIILSRLGRSVRTLSGRRRTASDRRSRGTRWRGNSLFGIFHAGCSMTHGRIFHRFLLAFLSLDILSTLQGVCVLRRSKEISKTVICWVLGSSVVSTIVRILIAGLSALQKRNTKSCYEEAFLQSFS